MRTDHIVKCSLFVIMVLLLSANTVSAFNRYDEKIYKGDGYQINNYFIEVSGIKTYENNHLLTINIYQLESNGTYNELVVSREIIENKKLTKYQSDIVEIIVKEKNCTSTYAIVDVTTSGIKVEYNRPVVGGVINAEFINDDWKKEWMGEESQEGINVTTNELQDAIHHWLEDISVRGHTMSTEDLQEIIAVWLSPEAILKEIEGLTAIRVSGGVWDNWDADMENDGPVIEICYIDAIGNTIYNDNIEEMPISAEVNIYAGETSISPRTKLVFSAGFTEDQIIFTYCGPEIRIPKEEISVNPSTDYQYGDVEVTIYTTKQGSFADKSEFIKLCEDE